VKLFACAVLSSTITNLSEYNNSSIAKASPKVTRNGTHKFGSYSNSRYAFFIEYPEDVFVGQGESGSGDGQRFTAKNGAGEFSVWGELAMDFPKDTPLTCETAYKRVLGQTPGTTYKAKGKDWFVFSGYDDKGVFYKKVLFQDGQLKTLLVNYPRNRKTEFDPIVQRMAKSFR